jgi:hypothetical protein
VFAIAGGLLIVVVAGLGAWAALSSGRYGRSAGGCVNVVEPSSTGGAMLHARGIDPQALCRRAFTHHSKLDLLIRPQCRLAGIAPRRLRSPTITPVRAPVRAPVRTREQCG